MSRKRLRGVQQEHPAKNFRTCRVDRLEELKNQTRKIHSSAISGLGFWTWKSIRTSRWTPISLRNFKILPMSQTSTTFLKISTGSSSFRWEAQIGHAFPEEIVVNPRFPMGIPRNRRESGDSCDKPAMLIRNPSFLIRFPEN